MGLNRMPISEDDDGSQTSLQRGFDLSLGGVKTVEIAVADDRGFREEALRLGVRGVSSPSIICRDVVVMGSKVNDVPLVAEMPPGDVRGFDVRTGKQ